VGAAAEWQHPSPERARLRCEIARRVELVWTLKDLRVAVVTRDDDQDLVPFSNPVTGKLEVSICYADDRRTGWV
jgi:hypothetical protein